MVEPREIRYPIQLTTAELSYLLSLVHAQTLQGGDDQALFPPTQPAREALWQQGQAQLEADGWIVWDATAEQFKLNDELLLLVAAMADSEVVVLSSWKTADAQQHGVAHYIALDLVIEMAIQQGLYQIVALDSLATMTQRLAHSLGLPETRQPPLSFVLARQDIEYVKRNPDPAWLQSRGLEPHAAHLLATLIRQPDYRDTVTILRTINGQAVSMRMLGMLVAQGQALLGTPQADQHVRYDLIDADEFAALLSAIVSELRSSEVVLP